MLEIYIDQKKIDFTLENEKNLNDLVNSLEAWLASQSVFLSKLEVDNEEVNPADRLFFMQRPISSIKRINIYTTSFSDLESETSIEIMRYLKKIENALLMRSDEIYSSEAREGIRWLVMIFRLLAGIHNIDLASYPNHQQAISSALDNLEKALEGYEAEPQTDESKVKWKDALEQSIILLLKDGYQFLLTINQTHETQTDLIDETKQLAEIFQGFSAEITEIAIDLQSGKQVRAMTRIQKAVVLIEEVLRLLERAKVKYGINPKDIKHNDEDLQSWTEGLLELGKSIIEAFHNQDSVLLGDIFEYELGQELDKVPAFLGILLEQIS